MKETQEKINEIQGLIVSIESLLRDSSLSNLEVVGLLEMIKGEMVK